MSAPGTPEPAMRTEAPTPTPAAAPRGALARLLDSDLFHSFIRSPITVLSALVVLAILVAALLAPVIAPQNPFDPATLNLMDGFTRPMQANEFTGNVYWLGTDAQGRDLFSAILYG